MRSRLPHVFFAASAVDLRSLVFALRGAMRRSPPGRRAIFFDQKVFATSGGGEALTVSFSRIFTSQCNSTAALNKTELATPRGRPLFSLTRRPEAPAKAACAGLLLSRFLKKPQPLCIGGGANLWELLRHTKYFGATTFRCSGINTTGRCENVFTADVEPH